MTNESQNNEKLKTINYKDNASIFKFINPNNNTSLSAMKGFDLQELLILLDEYYLQLRSQLGLDSYITFGLEFEFEYVMSSRLEKQFLKMFSDDEWILKPDGSLTA